MPKIRKVSEKKIAPVGKHDFVEETWEEVDDKKGKGGKSVKVRKMPTVTFKIKR